MNKKQIISIIIVILVGIIAYNYLFTGSEESDSILIPESASVESADAKYILGLLNKMSSVRLDDSIFFSKAFDGLKDTTVILVKPSVGRPNPFAPINPAETVKTSTTTSQTR